MSEIHFNEKRHVYSRMGKVYTSVTTLIKGYTPPFDKDYWSTYKAIKHVLERSGDWNNYKWHCGGWENVVDNYRKFGHAMHDRIEYRKLELQQEWQQKAKTATDKGSAVHKVLEERVIGGPSVMTSKGMLAHVPQSITDPLVEKVNGIFVEAIVYNDTYKLAGMVDRIDKHGKELFITDHKTSKEITRNAFRDECLKPPVEHLPNANFYVYSLQLSLYGWMLEQFGYKVAALMIDHRDRDTGKLITTYPVDYLKDDIELILSHYGER